MGTFWWFKKEHEPFLLMQSEAGHVALILYEDVRVEGVCFSFLTEFVLQDKLRQTHKTFYKRSFF